MVLADKDKAMQRRQVSQSASTMAMLQEVDELKNAALLKRAAGKTASKKGRTKPKNPGKGKGVAAASLLLKSISNEKRLSILYLLQESELSVLEIASILRLRQPTVSQQLARLRADRLVKTRRDGQTIFYSLACDKTGRVLDLLGSLYGK